MDAKKQKRNNNPMSLLPPWDEKHVYKTAASARYIILKPLAAASEAPATGEYINLFQRFPIPTMISDIGTPSTSLESERPQRDISPFATPAE